MMPFVKPPGMEEVEARNALDGIVYQAEKTIRENREKLAEGASLVKRDGSVPFTAHVDHGAPVAPGRHDGAALCHLEGSPTSLRHTNG